MKKKRLLMGLVFALTLCASTALAGCMLQPDSGSQDPNSSVEETPTTIAVTLDYDADKGTAFLTDAEGKHVEEFLEGDKVTLTVAAKEGYTVKGVTLNGESVVLTGGSYTFTVTQNSTVAIEFEEAVAPKMLSQAAIDSIAGKVKFTGTYFYDEKGDAGVDSNHSISTTFGTATIHMRDVDSETGEVYYDEVYANRNGNLALVYRTIANGIDYQLSSVLFSDYYNQFSTLTPDDFLPSETEEDVFVAKESSLEKISDLATLVTNWVEPLASFSVRVEGDKITELHFVTAEITVGADEESEGVTYVSDYTLTVSEWGTAEVDSFYTTPYAHTADHDALDAALKKAAAAKNYTIVHFDHEDGYEDLEYHVFVSETAIYNGFENYGYVQLNGYVYPFNYDVAENVVTLSDAINVTSFALLRADFLSVCPELFAYEGEGVYVLRDEDLAAEILPYIGEGLDEIQFYGYTLNAKIVIDGDTLQSIEFDYYVYGALGHVKLTYSAFDETTVPVDFSNTVQTSVLDPFVGEYVDQYGNTAVITVEEGIVINDLPFVVESYDSEYGIFVGTWNDRSVYLGKQSARQLALLNEYGNVIYLFTLKTEEDVTVPEEYRGVWEQIEGEDGEVVDVHKLVITADSVTLDGVELPILSFDEYEGLVTVKDEVTYDFAIDTETGYMWVIIVENNEYLDIYKLQKTQSLISIPTAFVGDYEKVQDGVSYRIEITAFSITVIVNGTVYEAEITAYDDYEGFTLNINDAVYYLANAGYTATVDTIGFMSEDFHTINVRLDRVSGGDTPVEVGIPAAFIGSFVGEKNGVAYAVEIMTDGILVGIGDEVYIAEITAYDESEGFTLSLDGEEWYLMDAAYDDPISQIMLMSGDYKVYVTLDRVSGEEPVAVPEKFFGTYETEGYQITITADEVVIVIGGNAAEVEVVEFESEYDLFTLNVNGVVWYLMDAAYDDPISQIMVMSEDETVDALLDRKEEPPMPEFTMPKAFFGVFEGKDKNDVSYRIEITETGIYISGGLTEKVEITAYDEYEGFTLMIGGEEWYLMNGGYDEEINKIFFMKSDSSMDFYLNRVANGAGDS